jgi:signal transduction histidine kinase
MTLMTHRGSGVCIAAIKTILIFAEAAAIVPTEPTGEGTGLGRSISYDMVTRHGGTISLDRPAPAMSRSAHAIISENSPVIV